MVETGSLGYTTNMGSIVLLAEAAEAIDTIGNGLDALFATGMSPADDRDAIQWITELETLSRRVAAAQTGLVAVIDRDNLHAADGHAPAKVMVRHHAKLSEGDAKARTQVAAACRDLPDVAEAWQAGQVGASQMRVIGEVHANPRVRPEMEARQLRLLDDAKLMSATVRPNNPQLGPPCRPRRPPAGRRTQPRRARLQTDPGSNRRVVDPVGIVWVDARR